MPVAAAGDFRVIKIEPMHLKGAVPLMFPSIITQYEDSWSPQWRQEQVYGRMDPIAFYGGTERKLTLAFRVISDDLDEAQRNMIYIQKLIQYQYPSFKNRSGGLYTIKAPPYFKIKFMNIASEGVRSLQGYINSPISINPGFQAKGSPQYFSEDFKKMLFSDVTINLQMTVLHAKNVGFYKGNTFGRPNMQQYPYEITGIGSSATVDSNNIKKQGSGVEESKKIKVTGEEYESAATSTDQACQRKRGRKKKLKNPKKCAAAQKHLSALVTPAGYVPLPE